MRGSWNAAVPPELPLLAVLAPLLTAVLLLLTPQRALSGLARPLSLMAIGLMLAIAVAHLIPEAMEAGDGHVQGLVLLGTLFVLMALEMLLSSSGRGRRAALARGALPLLGAVFVHSLSDGILLASAYLLDPQLGRALAAAIVMHELPHELGDFGVLLSLRLGRRAALCVPAMAALGALLGVAAGHGVLASVQELLPLAAAVAAGSFMYVALTDLLPRLTRPAPPRVMILRLALISAGAALALALSHH